MLDSLNIEQIDGIFFDLGVSSYQLDTPERGFSYMHDGPLDMRMDKSAKLSAEYIVNNYSESELADIIHRYGEERWSKRIAAFIAAERKTNIFLPRLTGGNYKKSYTQRCQNGWAASGEKNFSGAED